MGLFDWNEFYELDCNMTRELNNVDSKGLWEPPARTLNFFMPLTPLTMKQSDVNNSNQQNLKLGLGRDHDPPQPHDYVHLICHCSFSSRLSSPLLTGRLFPGVRGGGGKKGDPCNCCVGTRACAIVGSGYPMQNLVEPCGRSFFYFFPPFFIYLFIFCC